MRRRLAVLLVLAACSPVPHPGQPDDVVGDYVRAYVAQGGTAGIDLRAFRTRAERVAPSIEVQILLDHLNANIELETCRRELWNVSPLTGWLNSRNDVETEIANLREGLRLGYVAPRFNVLRVIEQAKAIVARDTSAAPVSRYARFLELEYLPRARALVGVSEIPNGRACFDALIRRYTSSTVRSTQLDSIGRELLSRAAAARASASTPVGFRDASQLVAHADSLLTLAWTAAPRFFANLPDEPPPHATIWSDADRNGPSAIYVPAKDTSKATILINPGSLLGDEGALYLDRLMFHEGVPGHHLQAIYAKRAQPLRIMKVVLNTGYVEGWAVYASNLADEMGLYSSEVARTPVKSARVDDAMTFIVQSGLHIHRWSPEQAVDTIVKLSGVPRAEAEQQVAYFIAAPAHALAYPVGARTFEGLRALSQQRLGSRFDIREFHRVALENGPLPLSLLTHSVETWIQNRSRLQ